LISEFFSEDVFEVNMSEPRKTAIVTGASQGIGAGIVKGFVERGFNIVANSRKMTQSTEIAASDHVALVDGHIGEPATAAKIVETALSRFKSIDVLVNNPASSSPSRSRTTRPRISSRLSRRTSRVSCTSPNSPSSKC
jgi:NAD(P)-dependent dehydrogenase (short-subunit alcohol dehydrogenase family)